MDLSDFINQILFQIAYTNNLEDFEKDRTLRAIRDGSCTHIIKNLKLNVNSKKSILNTSLYHLDVASEINNRYLSCINTSLKEKYFYVYRFVSLPNKFFKKSILYPSLISTSWNFEFVKDWARKDSFSFREGMFQKIKVSRTCNFLTSSFPNQSEIWEELESCDNKFYMKIHRQLLESFKKQNNMIKNGLGKNKLKYELINQVEQEVVLPPGKMKFKKIDKFNGLDIYEYDFFETHYDDIESNIDFCINKGTII